MKLSRLKMPYQSEWIIGVDDSELLSHLKKKYGVYIVDCDRSDRIPDVCMTKKEGNIYAVTIEGTVSITSHPVSCLDGYLFEHPSYEASVFAMHGAAVEWKGKSYVFLAATTSGKTTLTSYLVHRGFGYMTDDCVLLDRQTHGVHPFSTPLHLRQGGVRVLERYGALPEELCCLGEDDGACRYVYTPKNPVERSLPLGEIFFIERTETENSVCDMSSSEKMVSLMKSPITAYPIDAAYLRFLASLGAKYGKRLKYGDMSFVEEVLKQYES